MQKLACDQNAERGIIAILVTIGDNGKLFNEISEIVSPEDFFVQANRIIFEAIGAIIASGVIVDGVILSESLKHAGKLKSVGGYVYISKLQEEGSLDVSPYMAMKYAAIIKEKAILRVLQLAAEGMRNEAFQELPSSDIMNKFLNKIIPLSIERKTGSVEHIRELVKQVGSEAEERFSQNAYMSGYSTGLRNLDRVTKGLKNKDFIILAARPSVGKSALAGNIAVNVADNGRKVLFFSLEMSGKALTRRFISYKTCVKTSRMETGRMTDQEWKKFREGSDLIANVPIKICEDYALSPAKIIAMAREEKTQNGLDLIIVDYIQLMRTDNRRDSRELDISEISRSLKSVAKELDIPVLALSQLNREVEKRDSGKPRLSDLRESGTLEQDADIVMFLWREKDNSAGITLTVAKNRDGKTGDVVLSFEEDTVSFREMIREVKSGYGAS